jgi:hypothetical protein
MRGKTVTPNLARHIQIARHNIYGTHVDEEYRIEQQRASAIEDFQTYIGRKMDLSVRMELFVPATWGWDDASGATVRFSVDGQNFVLAQKDECCHLFKVVNGINASLAVLPDKDRQQFTDHLLVEIGDALERANLP